MNREGGGRVCEGLEGVTAEAVPYRCEPSAGFHFVLHLQISPYEPCDAREYTYINKVCPPCAIPRRKYAYGDGIWKFEGLTVAVGSTEMQLVGSSGQVGQRYTSCAGFHILPVAVIIIETVGI